MDLEKEVSANAGHFRILWREDGTLNVICTTRELRVHPRADNSISLEIFKRSSGVPKKAKRTSQKLEIDGVWYAETLLGGRPRKVQCDLCHFSRGGIACTPLTRSDGNYVYFVEIPQA